MKIWFICIAISFLLVYVVSPLIEARMDFEERKRKKIPMFWCPQKGHGYFKKEHCIQLFPDMQGVPENSYICPMCYKQNVFDIPNERLK